MLKHAPKYLVSKATTPLTKPGGSKKRWLLITKSNSPGESKLHYIARNGELPPFQYYPQVYLRSLPNQLMEQQNSFFEFMWMFQEMVAFELFALWGIVQYLKRYQMSLSAHFSCVGVVFRFKISLNFILALFCIAKMNNEEPILSDLGVKLIVRGGNSILAI